MSENKNLPELSEEPTTDLTQKDLDNINTFINEGLPGVTTIDNAKMTRIMDLYLNGKTYRQISTITRINRSLILYLSQRFNWYMLRREYLTDLESSIKGRLIEAKVINQDFLLQLTHLWQKKIGSKINEYLATGNEDYANAIDLKEVDKYLKTVAMLMSLSGEGSPKNDKPAVGLNLGEGVTIKKMSNNEVEITPKNKAIGDVLKQLADLKREQEASYKKAKYDIKKEIDLDDKGEDNVD